MLVIIENLSKKIKDQLILNNINLKFEGGKIYGLQGKNGSGKSMLLKIICGLYDFSDGKIIYNNISMRKCSKPPMEIRASIENPFFFPYLTGYQNLKILADIQGKISTDEINNALDTVNLVSEKNKKYGKYSYGMKQKLSIAQAIMEPSEMLILDEPFNGIDEDSVRKIKSYILKEKNAEKIIIITSHIKEDLLNLCDVIIEIENGTISNEISNS